MPRSDLINGYLSEQGEQLLNQPILTYIGVLALAVFGFAAGVVHIEGGGAVDKALLLLLGSDARAAHPADHELSEGEVLKLFLRAIVLRNLVLHCLE